MNNDSTLTGNTNGSNNAQVAGKKAVHVKWAGKTIALGTFPSAEADEKCARAKALTRAWRSTMRPKPTREWVMTELERLGVRVVSGRLGRKAGDEEDSPAPKKSTHASNVSPPSVANRKDSLGMGFADLDNLMQQRRNSSLGLSMLSDDLNINRRGSMGSLGPSLGLDGGNGGEPPHRPYVGGGAGAAFEAARADHYAQKREEQQRRASSLGLGGMGGMGSGSASMPQMGLSVNPNQHYEMLKLHHMNLLNEIQETTLMMNLYQQQQLQQQQQQLQQQHANNDNSGTSGGSDHMSILGGGVSMDGMYNTGVMSQGMGGIGTSNAMGLGNQQQQQLIQQSDGSSGRNDASHSSAVNDRNGDDGNGNSNSDVQDQLLKSQEEQKALEEQLKKLKEDIAKSKIEAKELQKLADESKCSDDDDDTGGSKRKAEETSDPEAKKVKSEERLDGKLEN